MCLCGVTVGTDGVTSVHTCTRLNQCSVCRFVIVRLCRLDLASLMTWLSAVMVRPYTWVRLGPIECGSSHNTKVSQ